MADLLRKVPQKFKHNPTLPQEIFCSCFDFLVPYPTTRCILPSALQEGSESLDVTWEKQNWTALNSNVPVPGPNTSTSNAANLPVGTVSEDSDDISAPAISPAVSTLVNDYPSLRLVSDSGPSSLVPMSLLEEDINIEMPDTTFTTPSGLELSSIPALEASIQPAILPDVEMTLIDDPGPIATLEEQRVFGSNTTGANYFYCISASIEMLNKQY
ncbi:hypothetical protein C8J56DRAFT_880879 [Mycena floridula]|nr:hypothetical protein C8J56DRAFT_880879 [Mycena floridula]